ncbi:MAG TPA: hypothetical protein VHH88_04955 [Verrucomicrobiae bacterium]|nr:hypothetical protein [Verrucomicrobiae bacterium]
MRSPSNPSVPAAGAPELAQDEYLRIGPPKKFGFSAIAVLHLYNLALFLPVIISLMVVSLFRLGIPTLLVPLLTIAATAYILPFGIGNAYIRRLTRRVAGNGGCAPDGFIVQISLRPRLRTGLRALVEDADDVGMLVFGSEAIEFTGDSVQLRLPYSEMAETRAHNIGLRGRFLYGQPIEIKPRTLGAFEAVEFTERSSLVLPESKRISTQMAERLSTALQRSSGMAQSASAADRPA